MMRIEGLVIDPHMFVCPKCGSGSRFSCIDGSNNPDPPEPHQERINRAVKAIADAFDALIASRSPVEVRVVNDYDDPIPVSGGVQVEGTIGTYEAR